MDSAGQGRAAVRCGAGRLAQLSSVVLLRDVRRDLRPFGIVALAARPGGCWHPLRRSLALPEGWGSALSPRPMLGMQEGRAGYPLADKDRKSLTPLLMVVATEPPLQ